MSEPFTLGARARRDLVRIAAFLEMETGPERARSVIIELRRSFRILALLPRIGHPRADLVDDEEVRFWTVYSYLIAYLPGERPLFIARILHGARSPEDLRAELRSPEEAEEGPSLQE